MPYEICAPPPGERDLAHAEYWTRSLERSLRRRALAEERGPRLPRTTQARLSAALAVATLAGSASVPAGASAARSHHGVHRTLERGSHGEAVRALQRVLGIPADGIFGPQTRRAVKRFQREHGLEADGVVGRRTRAALGLERRTPARSRSASAQAPEPAAVAEGAAGAVAAAQSRVGARYASGGNGPRSFDCSGLTTWAFRKAGVQLPRTSYAQYERGAHIHRDEIQPGDLVFFDTGGGGASHVGIAVSPSTAISATTHGVMEHAIATGYWGDHYLGARRI